MVQLRHECELCVLVVKVEDACQIWVHHVPDTLKEQQLFLCSTERTCSCTPEAPSIMEARYSLRGEETYCATWQKGHARTMVGHILTKAQPSSRQPPRRDVSSFLPLVKLQPDIMHAVFYLEMAPRPYDVQ